MAWLVENWMWLVGLALLVDIAGSLRSLSAKSSREDDELAALRMKHDID